MTGPVPYHSGRFPPEDLDWSSLIPLLGPASAALAHYDGLLSAIPNAAVLLSPLTTQEAVLSSRIEGTLATMGEVLEYEASGAEDSLDPQKEADIEEVLKYRRAMRQAIEMFEALPLCNRLIRTAHETLLSGVRGHDKARGQFRKIQNYIGAYGDSLENARFVHRPRVGRGGDGPLGEVSSRARSGRARSACHRPRGIRIVAPVPGRQRPDRADDYPLVPFRPRPVARPHVLPQRVPGGPSTGVL